MMINDLMQIQYHQRMINAACRYTGS